MNKLFYNVPSEFQLSDKEALKIAIERTNENIFDYYAGLTFNQNCITVYKSWEELFKNPQTTPFK